MSDSRSLGLYLRDRRTRLDPVSLGFPRERRRTPGLRREEVAQRAIISTTWYTWLEQGRGGAPSAQVLDRLAGALLLTDVEREYLFLLGLGRPPEAAYKPAGDVTPRLQRVLDSFGASPAMVRTATWDVVAWNRAAALVLTDYGTMPPSERNILRLVFLDPKARAANHDWEGVARFVVAVFRADAARAGAAETIQPLVDDLCRQSPAFAAMWRDSDVRTFGDGVKTLRHPILGEITLEYSSFAVDGRADLSLLVYTPVGDADRDRIAARLAVTDHAAEPLRS